MSELILILVSDLYLFRSPIGVYRTYTYSTEFTLVRRYPKVSQRLRDVYWSYRTYPYMKVLVSTTKLIFVLRILLVLRSISWSYGAYTYLMDTRLPLGTTGLIFILPLREYP